MSLSDFERNRRMLIVDLRVFSAAFSSRNVIVFFLKLINIGSQGSISDEIELGRFR